MFLTWKVSTTSLSTTSRSSWWNQKHLTVGLYRTGFENSKNSCPTSQIPGFGRLFSFHTTSVPDVTAQLLVWEKRGRGQTKARTSWPLVHLNPSAVPVAVPAASPPQGLGRMALTGKAAGPHFWTQGQSQRAPALLPGAWPTVWGGFEKSNSGVSKAEIEFHRYCRTTRISYSIAPRGQHHLKLLRNPKSTWEQWETILRHKAKPFHSEPLQTGLLCHRNIIQRSKKLRL